MVDVDLPPDIANASAEVQRHYRKMIADGQTPRWAEMCALQQAPGVHGTNDSWMKGRKNGEWLDALPTKQAKWMLKEAKAAGISTEGKYYMSGIADSRAHLDRDAWVSDREDVLRVAKKRKLELRGQINYQPSGPPEPPKRANGLNPRLVSELAKKEMASEPGLTKRAAEQRIREKHTPHWQRKRS
jgi:hypothetical protein